MIWSLSDAYLAALVGALATYFWRAVGVAVGSRLDPRGNLFGWLGCVAHAVLAALILRLIVFPAGSLADLPSAARIGAALLAGAAYLLARRNVFLGCVAGSAAIAIAAAA